jgi:hypothetical protein
MMSIVDIYKAKFDDISNNQDSDLFLARYAQDAYVGVTNTGNVVVTVKAANANQSALSRRTKMISVECNMHMAYTIDGEKREGVFHIIKCFSSDKEEIYLFLELAALLIAEGAATKEHLLNTFQTLANFFADKGEPSNNELIGLYGELYAIKLFSSELSLENYWQSRDKLKFDFSISDNIKIEVKTTTKAQRIHHFKHEQLATSIYDIWIISFMLRHDDEGLSLLELINIAKPLLEEKTRNLLKVNRVLKNVDHERLTTIRFEEQLTQEQMKIYKAEEAPKFTETRPDGVSNAEYDCDFEQANAVPNDDFIAAIKHAQMQ